MITRTPTAPPLHGSQSTAKPTGRRRHRRPRKRTDQQRERENAKRHIQQMNFHARRKDCLAKERYVRQYVRTWIHSYGDAIGVAVDASILPYLPVDLREIMARSDFAIASYRGFCGQTKLCMALNEMPKWW